MCQGLGPKKHDEISEIDRIIFVEGLVPDLGLSPMKSPRYGKTSEVLFSRGCHNLLGSQL